MTDQPALCADPSADSSQPTSDVWRQEIHARVAGYRNRRGRRIEGAYTMRFPFPPADTTEFEPDAEVPGEPVITETPAEETVAVAQPDILPIAAEDSCEPILTPVFVAEERTRTSCVGSRGRAPARTEPDAASRSAAATTVKAESNCVSPPGIGGSAHNLSSGRSGSSRAAAHSGCARRVGGISGNAIT